MISQFNIYIYIYLRFNEGRLDRVRVRLNATFNNISVISRRSFLFMEKTGGLGEDHRPAASH